MRSALLVILSLLVIGTGFGVYWSLHGGAEMPPEAAVEARRPTHSTTSLPTTMETLVGPGERVWWERFDKETGERTSRLDADRYEPMKDGRVMVINPVIEFFLRIQKDEKGNVLLDAAGNPLQEVVRVVGRRGVIAMEEGFRTNQNSISGGTPSQTPRSGDLENVTLYLYASMADAMADEEYVLDDGGFSDIATMTLVTHNASFDSETFRVATEEYVNEEGERIPADRVAVTVRGTEYEFDGAGLTLQYNQRDRRLEYLRIAHGQRLKVLKPGGFLEPEEKKAGEERPGVLNAVLTRPAAGWMVPAWRKIPWAPANPIEGYALAQRTLTDPPVSPPTTQSGRRRRNQAAPLPTTRPKTPTPVYRATFHDNVRVLQSEQTIAFAHQLQIDFLEEGADGDTPATQPAAPAAAAMSPDGLASVILAADLPTTRPSTPRDRRTRISGRRSAATTAPSTQPADKPIEIFWTGPLEIVPLPGPRPERIAPGESIVQLLGTNARPAELFRKTDDVTTHIKAGRLTHWSLDSGVLLETHEGVPVTMKDTRGTDILTPTMVFSETDGTALLIGQSRARLPLDDASKPTTQPMPGVAAAPPAMMDVAWSDRCMLYLKGGGLEQMILSRADLRGGVRVNHPEVDLQSRDLTLFFAPDDAAKAAAKPATTQPSRDMPPLREMQASGDVFCIMRGPGGEEDVRTFKTENLRILTDRTPDGRLYARTIDAEGDVFAKDPKQELTAGIVSITLNAPKPKPATRPAIDGAAVAAIPATQPAKKPDFDAGDLERFEARDNVRVVTADGKTAHAARMTIDGNNGDPLVTLFGDPIARVTHEQNTLSGATIIMKGKSQELIVNGPGRLDGVQEDKPEPAPATPGAVAVATTEPTTRPVTVTWESGLRAEASKNLVECTGNVLALSTDADGSINKAMGQRILLVMMPTTRPTTQPAAASTQPASDFNALGGRSIRSIIIQEGAVVESSLIVDNSLLRMFHVKSEMIHYDKDQRRLNIPQAGEMLFVDERPPSTQPAAQEASKDPMGVKGKTAFEWNRGLLYDEATHQVTMLGDVVIARVPQRQGGSVEDPLRLEADCVVADLVPAPAAPTTQPATRPAQPAGGFAAMTPKMQLKRVTAEAAAGGIVTVSGTRINVQASRIEYDPVAHLLTVHGTPARPARWLDANGIEQAQFESIQWNTQTANIVNSRNWRVRSLK